MISINDHVKLGGRHRNETSVICLHRVSRAKDDYPERGIKPIPDDQLTGPLVAAWYHDMRKYRPGFYTGGEDPYVFLVRTDGQVDQCRPMTAITPHARSWSTRALAIAIAGDFREHPPTELQIHTTEQLCGLLCAMYGADAKGHDELPGGTSDRSKRCPGDLFPVAAVAAEAQRIAAGLSREDAARILAEAGAV